MSSGCNAFFLSIKTLLTAAAVLPYKLLLNTHCTVDSDYRQNTMHSATDPNPHPKEQWTKRRSQLDCSRD
jgi:hypothetical protein